MNRKLFPAALVKSKLTTALSACSLVATLGVVACDGNDDNNRPDVSRPDTTQPDTTGDTTTPTDTTQPDTVTPPVDTVQPPDVVEQQKTVKAAQVLAAAVTCDPSGFTDIDPAFTIENVVVTSPKFDFGPTADPTAFDGYFVADQDGGAYSGIVLRIAAANRPATALVPGDVLDVTGQLKDVFCWTQIEASTLSVKTPVTPPTPVTVVPASDIAQEAYESMLVKVTDVTVEAASAQGGLKFTPGDVGIGFYSSFGTGFIGLTQGSTYDITGVIRVNFGAFQLVPRYPSDVVLKSAAANSIVGIQSTDLSKNCPSQAPQFQNGARGIQTEGTVVVPRYTVSRPNEPSTENPGLDGYVIADGSQAPYSGIHVTFSASAAHSFAIGDRVRVTGNHVEYFCLTQFSASSIELIGSESEPITPVLLDKAISTADLEQWEGMLVEFKDVKVTGDDTFGAATTEGVFLIDRGIMGSSFVLPAKDAVIPTLRGIITYSFNKFRVSPRSAADYAID